MSGEPLQPRERNSEIPVFKIQPRVVRTDMPNSLGLMLSLGRLADTDIPKLGDVRSYLRFDGFLTSLVWAHGWLRS